MTFLYFLERDDFITSLKFQLNTYEIDFTFWVFTLVNTRIVDTKKSDMEITVNDIQLKSRNNRNHTSYTILNNVYKCKSHYNSTKNNNNNHNNFRFLIILTWHLPLLIILMVKHLRCRVSTYSVCECVCTRKRITQSELKSYLEKTQSHFDPLSLQI